MRTEQEWQDRERQLLTANVAMREEARWAAMPGAFENRVKAWVITRLGEPSMNRKERAMRLLEEAAELVQSEGISAELARKQIDYVYDRPAGDPVQEAGGVAVCLLAWCASIGVPLHGLALCEIERIERKPIEQIRGSLARKPHAGLEVHP